MQIAQVIPGHDSNMIYFSVSLPRIGESVKNFVLSVVTSPTKEQCELVLQNGDGEAEIELWPGKQALQKDLNLESSRKEYNQFRPHSLGIGLQLLRLSCRSQ